MGLLFVLKWLVLSVVLFSFLNADEKRGTFENRFDLHDDFDQCCLLGDEHLKA